MSFFEWRTKKRERRSTAAALAYDPCKTDPPQVVASGRGMTAAEIVRVAREHGVPVHEDAALVEALAALDCSRTIPHELYAVVAEVLAFVYVVDARAKAGS